ncbi:shikimate kinase, chloroplastic-like isoform X2 [Sesamum indicum]|uniref:shikimate kinase n=1 Tax=Sesamum indicum TaxID=4182 RepID=A0A6I9UKE9_SESIN|nr:shikimate kinase, chloroplastic-like isoform X2 [Sesamum indicum]
MEAKVLQGMQSSTWIMRGRIVMRKQDSSLQFFQKSGEQKWSEVPASCCFPTSKRRSHRLVVLRVSCSSGNVPVLESGSLPTLLDESKILKNKAEEMEPYINGRCIYLVGMMGSGKTTVGKVLSDALGYSFCDCDTLIEQAVGVSTVAEIFEQYGEGFFRDNETEVLQKLSSMHRHVVSTGGGAVIRPINWRHMQKGISIWLDVPVEVLAQRIMAVGTDSRPLLHQESGDPFSRIMKRLSTLLQERGEAYGNADARVSLENIASKLGLKDVCNVTSTAISIEVLSQIEYFLKK